MLDARTALAAAEGAREDLAAIGDDALVGEVLRRRAKRLEIGGIVRDANRLARELEAVIRGEDGTSFSG
jgi:hypothetical protein